MPDIRIGEFAVDRSLHTVSGPSHTVRLEPKVMLVLLCLAEHRNQVVSKERLMRAAWPDTFVTDDVLTRAISELRRAFGDSVRDSRFIQTIPKSGYRLIAPVCHTNPDDAGAPSEEARRETLPSSHADSAEVDRRRLERDIESGRTDAEISAAAQLDSSWRTRSLLIGTVAALVVSGAAWLYFSRSAPEPPTRPMETLPLTSFPGRESAVTFSPDGNQVAFVWDGENGDNEDIYTKVVGAGAPVPLTTSPAPDRHPAWSPDGRYIAFIRVSEGEAGIFLVPPLGGVERKIDTAQWEYGWDFYGAGLSWSPDGKYLVLSDKSTPQGPATLFVLSIDRLERRTLTFPPPHPRDGHVPMAPVDTVGDLAPAIAPDGQTVAFYRLTSLGTGDIYRVPFAGGEPQRLTFEETWIERLAWTPDGLGLVFSSGGPFGSSSLWRVSASGGKPERLPLGDNAAQPAISSRANRLAYVQRSADVNIRRLLMPRPLRTATSSARFISSTRPEAGPQFSPDGRRIVFESNRSGTNEIWVCDVDGLNLFQLTSFGGEGAGTPRWSPDSRRIAFDARSGGHADIHVVDAEGGVPRRVTTEPSDEVVPSWSSDGKWIYFASNRTGSLEVWKVPVRGGQAVQVTKQGGFAAFESLDGRSLYYAKGLEVAGLWKVPVNGGEEVPVLQFPRPGYWGYWAVVDKGIYFLNTTARPHPLEFFDFATRRTRQLASLEYPAKPFVPGLAVSRDERTILYVQQDQRNGDIMLVENFR